MLDFSDPVIRDLGIDRHLAQDRHDPHMKTVPAGEDAQPFSLGGGSRCRQRRNESNGKPGEKS